MINTLVLFKLEAVGYVYMKSNIKIPYLDFYNQNSMTCTSQLFDPSVESDFVERNLQHIVGWQNLSSENTVVRLTSGWIKINGTI